MRKRLAATAAMALALAASAALGTPALAKAGSSTASLDHVAVLAHGAAAGTTVIGGHNKPGTRMHIDGTDTAAGRTLSVDYQVQQTGYWCGPAATRIALSARISPPSQSSLAGQLNTDEEGTDWIGQVTGVLNANLGTGWYETKEMPNDPPTQAQRDLLWRDVVLDIDNNYPIVANIVAPPGNQPPGYPSNQTIYHYFTVIGYDETDSTVLIADPASFSGYQIYWLSFNQLATLIPPKGYSA